MKIPGADGIFFINGKDSGYLSVYDLHTKTSTDIVPDLATQPTLSRDGKRVMYVTAPEPNKNELWVADIDGNNQTKLAEFKQIGAGDWSPDGVEVTYTKMTHRCGSKLRRQYRWQSSAPAPAFRAQYRIGYVES